jgi:hypothetical protein
VPYSEWSTLSGAAESSNKIRIENMLLICVLDKKSFIEMIRQKMIDNFGVDKKK